ncbi:MAG TPA: type II secretion system protein GspK [Planctomycetaceae bacterium]|nr:type II secretion system protein GspK [Planctomycetaceae bacterium]
MRHAIRNRSRTHSRRGFVLLVVTIVIILLSLAAYSFLNRMQVEQEATMMYGRDVEARMAAESGIEYAAIQVGLLATDATQDVFHNPGVFRGQVMNEADNPRGQCRFTILVPNELSSAKGESVRFGMARETAKFNINRLTEFEKDDDETTTAYDAISNIPGMTEEIANAILDWIDSDEERRVGGAETPDYQGLAIPYSARNALLESIEELLQIQGVTPELFYGEDANRNGMLDPNEDDGNESLPNDNQDGVLDVGWREYFTVSSRERNKKPDGEKKININGSIMTELFDEIEDAVDTETATFIVAYRLWGNENADPATVKSLTVDQKELAKAIAGGLSNPDGISITRAGMNLNQVAAYSFRSIYDVIDAEVDATIEGGPQTLMSPWTSANLLDTMPDFEANFTYLDDDFADGRINVNIARREVLLAIPDMTETIADSIVSMRPPIESSGMASSAMSARTSPTWLLGEGVVDLNTFRRLGPWLTTGGDIFSFQALGHFDQGGPTTRLEAMIDGTQNPPRIIFQRDLTSLGRGFHPSQLSSH